MVGLITTLITNLAIYLVIIGNRHLIQMAILMVIIMVQIAVIHGMIPMLHRAMSSLMITNNIPIMTKMDMAIIPRILSMEMLVNTFLAPHLEIG